MAYSSIAKPTDYFNTVLYTGNGSDNNAITGVGFQPDWVWLKNRSTSNSHYAQDSVRGATKNLKVDATDGEETRTGSLKSFDSDGFTLGTETAINGSGNSLVSWNWLSGGSASSNSDGGTSSTVSVNTTAGFSIVGWAGAGSATTVGHGLGVAPKVVLVKNRSEVYGWQMYHESLGNGKYVSINSSDAAATSSQSWNDTSPTSSVFSVGASDSNNKSGNNIIAYCFAEKQGYSKLGQYEGNANADGTYIYTGFKPAVVIVKNIDAAENWIIFDNKRPGYNLTDALLKPSSSNAESTSGVKFDLLSNGFKARVSDAEGNSSATFIYLAFAENPFVGNDSGTAVPVTAG
jgi:hypothetical protein